MADGSAFHANRPQVRLYRCCECETMTRLADLNSEMLCASCGEPDEDPEYAAPTAGELFRSESTWSV